jgi:hypothetical protein
MRRFAITVSGLVLIVAGTDARAQQAREDASFSWSKQLRAGSTITIRNVDGPIQMREVAGDRVEVRATKIVRSRGSVRDVSFDVRETDAGVTICTIYGRQSSCRAGGVSSGAYRVRVEYTVLVPTGINADLSTGIGEVNARFASTPPDGVMSFKSGTGTVHVGLPADFSGRIDARTGNGSLRSDFEMGVMSLLSGHELQATIGRGANGPGNGPLLRLQTGTGHIEVRKN